MDEQGKLKFESPNYTQMPNDLVDSMLPELGEAELRVLLVVIRQTFGYHHDQFSMSFRGLAEATGLSASNAARGASDLEMRGLIEKISDGNKTTAWRVVTSVPVRGTPNSKRVPNTGTPRTCSEYASVPVTDTQSALKERKKETETNPLVNLPSSCEWENSSAAQAQQAEQPAPRTDAVKKGDALDAYLAFGQKTAQDEFLWMPDYIRPLAQAFAEATKIYPTASERGQWIKALEVHHKRGATPSSERQAVRTSIQKSMAIKSPASVTYAIKPVEENLPRYV